MEHHTQEDAEKPRKGSDRMPCDKQRKKRDTIIENLGRAATCYTQRRKRDTIFVHMCLESEFNKIFSACAQKVLAPWRNYSKTCDLNWQSVACVVQEEKRFVHRIRGSYWWRKIHARWWWKLLDVWQCRRREGVDISKKCRVQVIHWKSNRISMHWTWRKTVRQRNSMRGT